MNTTLAAFYNTYRNAKDYHNFVSKLQQKITNYVKQIVHKMSNLHST